MSHSLSGSAIRARDVYVATLYLVVFLICLGVSATVRSSVVRQVALLAGSYAVYIAWGSWFAAVLLFSTAMNFLLGKMLRRNARRLVLATAILLNLALLGSFKYLPPLAVSVPFASLQRFAHLALPLGISFWTFQAMSYVFDLYRGEELDPTFIEFALYMVFFPIAISGPICRLPDMLPQFRSDKAISWEGFSRGLARVATGIFMMQLARLLSEGILSGDGLSSGFDHLSRWSGPDVWCLAFGYGLQLFFDFAGYSHIAIGTALVLGFTLPENFARPFQSVTPSVFWTRWHMSLSFWIRDYVFLPLAMIRREYWWRTMLLVVSMVLFGLWHKATILFLLWGLYQGVLLVLHRQVQQVEYKLNWNPPERLWSALSWTVTITLISLGWIFFRANSWSEARQMLVAIASPTTYAAHFLSSSLYFLVAVLSAGYALVVVTTGILDQHSATVEAATRSGPVALIARWRWYWIPALYALAMFFVWMVTLGQHGGAAQLMYRGF
jgi:alginate O-acetyltransferase complex protein AlgI